ncbi:MAG: hypothetical protein HON32_04405 [Francisellaceae bacterium]|jgi:hypothetical protein|nr:hypothetical protein [Francisellaceae bacterium]
MMGLTVVIMNKKAFSRTPEPTPSALSTNVTYSEPSLDDTRLYCYIKITNIAAYSAGLVIKW